MSRSRNYHEFGKYHKGGSNKWWKEDYNRAFRRTNKQLLKKFEDELYLTTDLKYFSNKWDSVIPRYIGNSRYEHIGRKSFYFHRYLSKYCVWTYLEPVKKFKYVSFDEFDLDAIIKADYIGRLHDYAVMMRK
jgi:hypothetical protein